MSKSKIEIINCHSHLFTLKHVPDRFLPFGLSRILDHIIFQKQVLWLLRLLSFGHTKSLLARYANFLEIGGKDTQEEVYKVLNSYYPKNTRYIVLPMDMAWMEAGKPPVSLEEQHKELAELALKEKGLLLPFIAVDPRRQRIGGQSLTKMVEELLDYKHDDGITVFKGIKLYPPLGYLPDDPALSELWHLCEEKSLPLMTHCSKGGIKSRALSWDTAASYADPDHFIPVLRKHPNLRLCLAHMGGQTDWQRYFQAPSSRRPAPLDAPAHERAHMNWLSKIMQMIESQQFPNLYTDISYTVFYIRQNMPSLKIFLLNDVLRSKTLFGSDFYMSERETFEERYLSMKLRSELGEKTYRQIACQNPLDYLGLQGEAECKNTAGQKPAA
ncbi:amidohydrolase family protein [Flexibacterium corallicola]|uniref:amidohydrolase family protein n=1 Tax=Flexibacterium corallicola TaxID=3037259 RepID=UPI00286F4617|nr:amidohydrolase family protein [Pseudovibrio sp. M1P-2-3]